MFGIDNAFVDVMRSMMFDSSEIYKRDVRISDEDLKNLRSYAIAASGGRCGHGCSGCPANRVRLSENNPNKTCIIRRLAQCVNADEQIRWLVETYRTRTTEVYNNYDYFQESSNYRLNKSVDVQEDVWRKVLDNI